MTRRSRREIERAVDQASTGSSDEYRYLVEIDATGGEIEETRSVIGSDVDPSVVEVEDEEIDGFEFSIGGIDS